ncbi:MAG: hypothetical protein V2A73_11225, partial [Pseudomonadota bacterium]
AALTALAKLDVGLARIRAHARLLSPRKTPDDFIVRARFVRVFVEELYGSARSLVVFARDPSEHVRQATARACITCRDPASGQALAILADPRQEASPRVRGVAAQVLGARAGGSAGEAECHFAAMALAGMVRSEPNPLTRMVACDAAADVCAGTTGVRENDERLVSTLDAGDLRRHHGRAGPRWQPPNWPAPSRRRRTAQSPFAQGMEVDSSPDGLSSSILGSVSANASVAVLVGALDAARGDAGKPAYLANAIARAAERARASAQPELVILRRSLESSLEGQPEGWTGLVGLPYPASDSLIGRTLAGLTQHDFGIEAWREQPAVLRLRRGERLTRKAWRIWYELTHPIASKRQGHLHTVGRALDSPLRAHSGCLAEVSRTRVPGERVFVAAEGGWAPYLPLVDDLLGVATTGVRADLFSEHGRTVIEPPPAAPARLRARTALTTRYAELALLRLRSLHAGEAGEAGDREAYLRAVTRLGFAVAFVPYHGLSVPDHILELIPERNAGCIAGCNGNNHDGNDHLFGFGFAGLGSCVPSLAMPSLSSLLGPALEMLSTLSRNGGSYRELIAFVAGVLVFLLGRSLITRSEIRSWRRMIPLVVGGWGTRGKSGVERLKAGLFHALGYEVLCKTTGCEATILLGIPGSPLRELAIFRPYEKATIWEQRDVLRFAAIRRPQVLLWECMALKPSYVEMLQRQWMRDDLSTITNAYPDHEDIQGPTGLDVSRVISRFVPQDSELVTAEEQMLPVLKERSRALRTRICVVERHAGDLLPQDMLDRFPYQEHPRNIALVLALAEKLGIDADVALAEMADNVLPDIGGLKTYGPIPVLGRRLRLTNGMSANERASAVGNWRRTGFDAHDADSEPGRVIVVMINNRADRAARSLVFADAIVEDMAAHQYLLIGSGVSYLRRAITNALEARLGQLGLAGIVAYAAHLKAGEATPMAAVAEITAWLAGISFPRAGELPGWPGLKEALTVALAARGPELPLVARAAIDRSGAKEALSSALQSLGMACADADEFARFAAQSLTRRRVAASLQLTDNRDLAMRIVGDLFQEALVVPPEPAGTADSIRDFLARSSPPGALVDIMGAQNIKGPGLRLVYLFAEAERARTIVADLAAPSRPPRPLEEQATTQLRRNHSGLRTASRPHGMAAASVFAFIRARVRRAIDHLASVRRRRRADRILADLAAGRISSIRAAQEIARLEAT